jgi:hypothetical protein
LAKQKRPITWMEIAVRNGGMRAAVTAVSWAYCWAVTREALGHEPTVEEVADWWSMARRSAFREQAAFRKAFPTLDNPGPIYSTPESRESVAKHAAFGEKVDRWKTERSIRKEADSVRAFMWPADPTA